MSFRDEGMVWLGSGMSIKGPCIKAWSWVWETAQELRVLVLPIDLTPISSTEVRWITTTCNSSFQGSNTLFILWRVPACVWLSLTHAHMHKKNLKRSSLVLTSALWRDGRKLEEVGLGGMVCYQCHAWSDYEAFFLSFSCVIATPRAAMLGHVPSPPL